MLQALTVFIKYLKYKRLRFSSRDSLEKWQRKKLRQMKKRVSSTIPFYKEYSKKDFLQWPLMNKDLYLKNFKYLNILGLELSEAKKFAEEAEENRNFSQKMKGYTLGISSGTSGKRTPFLVSESERLNWAGTVLAKFLKTLLRQKKISFVFRADSNLYQTVKSKVIQFRFFDLKNKFSVIVNDIEKFDGDIIVAPANVLQRLARLKKIGKFKTKPEKVISVAEVLNPETKAYIKEAFACEVGEVYQATEGFLAATCPEGSLHLNEESVYFEKKFVGESKKRFIPIITDLYRESQAFVRYELNDVLHLSENKCSCGSASLVIDKIEGRVDDVITLPGFDDKNHPVFPDFFRDIFSSCDAFQRYRLEQKSSKDLTFFFEGCLSDEVKTVLDSKFEKLWEKLKLKKPQMTYRDTFDFPDDQKHRRIVRSKDILF